MKEAIEKLIREYESKFTLCISSAKAHKESGNEDMFKESMKAAAGCKLMLEKYEEMLLDFK